MRRRGGLVIAVVMLLAAGCTSGEPAAVSRSTVFTSETLPGVDHVSVEFDQDPAPETVMDLGYELADTPTTTDPSAPAAEAPVDSTPSFEPVLLDPVPVGAVPSDRRSAPATPAGTTSTGHIEIPAIGLSHPTYVGVSLSVIDRGPSHWPGTARPGHAGNTVFPGHRTTHSRPFYDIDHLVPGDSVIFTTDEGRFTYRVTRSFVVDDEDTWIVKPTSKPTFTIFACHPKGSARQRYVVVGELVSAPVVPPTAAPSPTTTRPTTTTTEPRRGLLDLLFG